MLNTIKERIDQISKLETQAFRIWTEQKKVVLPLLIEWELFNNPPSTEENREFRIEWFNGRRFYFEITKVEVRETCLYVVGTNINSDHFDWEIPLEFIENREEFIKQKTEEFAQAKAAKDAEEKEARRQQFEKLSEEFKG